MTKDTSAIIDLKQRNIEFKTHTYPTKDGPIVAIDVANYMGFSVERLVKTLVTTDHHGGYYVFCLPAAKRIDMKNAARLVGAHNLTMLQPDMFEELTGYVHGGCSPYGMKTVLPLYVDEDVMKWDTIYLSGGRIGLTIEIDPKTLLEELGAKTGVFTR
ncbi:MAG: YbaK/EbsC family protein [Prevotella sp.]|jgi:Cys-tRNA(Pro)/Cys-tRNA(Cys) deacylase|nr:hypothetical protein [Prevotella sp.]